MKISRLLIVSVMFSILAAGCSSNRSNVETINNGVVLKKKDHHLRVQFYDHQIVRVTNGTPTEVRIS